MKRRAAVLAAVAALATAWSSNSAVHARPVVDDVEMSVGSALASARAAETTSRGNERAPAKKKPWKCQDTLAQVLHSAGFAGHAHQIAWAIVMRESKGQNLDESSPWYTGALGIWQIQTSAHSGKSWWSRANMLDPYTQSRIVYKYMTGKGTNWVPWGLNPDGTLNATNYGGWSSWHHENWIMAPFRQYYSSYPCTTHPPAKTKR